MTAHTKADQKNGRAFGSKPITAEHVAHNPEMTANGNALSIKQPNAEDFVPDSAGDR